MRKAPASIEDLRRDSRPPKTIDIGQRSDALSPVLPNRDQSPKAHFTSHPIQPNGDISWLMHAEKNFLLGKLCPSVNAPGSTDQLLREIEYASLHENNSDVVNHCDALADAICVRYYPHKLKRRLYLSSVRSGLLTSYVFSRTAPTDNPLALMCAFIHATDERPDLNVAATPAGAEYLKPAVAEIFALRLKSVTKDSLSTLTNLNLECSPYTSLTDATKSWGQSLLANKHLELGCPYDLNTIKDCLESAKDEACKLESSARAGSPGALLRLAALWPATCLDRAPTYLKRYISLFEKYCTAKDLRISQLAELAGLSPSTPLTPNIIESIISVARSLRVRFVPNLSYDSSIVGNGEIAVLNTDEPHEKCLYGETFILATLYLSTQLNLDCPLQKWVAKYLIPIYSGDSRKYIKLFAEWATKHPSALNTASIRISNLNAGDRESLARGLLSFSRDELDMTDTALKKILSCFERLVLNRTFAYRSLYGLYVSLLNETNGPKSDKPKKDNHREDFTENQLPLPALNINDTPDLGHRTATKTFELEPALIPLADVIVTKDTWARAEFNELCAELGLKPRVAVRRINKASKLSTGKQLIISGKHITINAAVYGMMPHAKDDGGLLESLRIGTQNDLFSTKEGPG